MLREVATKLVVYHHGKVEYLSENYDDFLKKIGWEEDESSSPAANREKPSRQEIKRLRSELIIDRGREISPLKKRMEYLENAIMKLEEEQPQLEAELIERSTQSDSKKIQETSQRLGSVKKKIEKAFEELTEVTIKHDDLFNKFEVRLKELET
jgi:ATP-binding cassette subfamily F protein 3